MIMVRLEGGLGNQMFQYSLGRHLAERRQQELVLDTSVLSRTHSKRRYALDCFGISGRTCDNFDHFQGLNALWIVREMRFGFNPWILENNCPNIMLHGFWQTYKYFEGIDHILKRDFRFLDDVPIHHSALNLLIRRSESICVHVRRTDYLESGYNMGFVGLEYYRKACSEIAEGLVDPYFFVFSDEPEWCREHLLIPYLHTIVPRDIGKNHFQLMTQCRHFVIANSTFSWWAAWLGEFPGKRVIAPSRWFIKEDEWDPDTSMHISSDLITPSSWIRL